MFSLHLMHRIFLEPQTSPAKPVPIESPGPSSAIVLGIFVNPFL